MKIDLNSLFLPRSSLLSPLGEARSKWGVSEDQEETRGRKGVYPSKEYASGIYESFENEAPGSAKEKADLPREGYPEERLVIEAATSENYHCHHQRQ